MSGPPRILIAPDKFKHALSAAAAADAMARGVRRARPDAHVEMLPLADGGEGSGAILAAALGAAERTARVRDALGRAVSARWWHIASERRGIVEMAEASGLWRFAAEERDALRASSFGTGELIAAALEAGCSEIVLCVGGSASVDGGAGCVQALGCTLLDENGREITPSGAGGGDVARVATIVAPQAQPGVRFRVLCDVINPLLGENGGARVFGPQKGATPAQVELLEAGLGHWASVLARYGGIDVASRAGCGAAGGVPAALVALMGAEIESGFAAIADCVGFARHLASADLCLTGEGRLDEQTLSGKVVAGAAQAARAQGVPVAAFVGTIAAEFAGDRVGLATRIGLDDIVPITPPGADRAQAILNCRAHLERAVAEYVTGRFPLPKEL